MAVQAKISALDQQVANATQQTVSDAVQLSQSSNVALNVSPDAIASYTREGTDLVVQLQNGEVLRLSNFYPVDEVPSQLFLVGEEEQLVAVDLSQAAVSDGVLAASYASESTLAGFESLTAGAATTGGALGLGGVTALGGAALVGGAVIADEVANDDSNDDPPVTEQPDSEPPAAATDLQLSEDARFLTGSAAPGTTVRIDIDGDGTADFSAEVDAGGRFVVPFDTPLTNGETISVVVVDAAGNTSAAATLVASNVQPTLVDASDGSLLSGTSAALASITMVLPSGQVLGTTTADANGNWSFTPSPAWPDGSVVDVQSVLPGGFRPPVVRIVIDAAAPDAPMIEAGDGTRLAGTAEAGSTVSIRIDGGDAIEVATDADGNWQYTPEQRLADGTAISVTATDRAGNVSPATDALVDAAAPAAPQIDNSNGQVFTGTAEAGSTLILSVGGVTLGQTLVDANGNWSFTASPAIASGTQVTAVARDAAGNSSDPATQQVNGDAPAAPSIAASDGTLITGTAGAGLLVKLSDGSGNAIGEVTADGSGNWSFTPNQPLADGTVIRAIAENAEGLSSAAASTVVDAAVPEAPQVEPSNGDVLSGVTEAGAKVILIYSNGQLIGQTTADAEGNWSFVPQTPLQNGDSVAISARDAVGNTSATTTLVIDREAPAAPQVEPSNGTTLSGSAEPDSRVTITGPGGVLVGEVQTDGAGNWSLTPAQALADGTPLSITAQDAAGNLSPPTSLLVDTQPPAAPTLAPTQGNLLSGTAEANSTLLISIDGAAPISVQTNASGDWSYAPQQPLAHATTISVVAQDASGNQSVAVDGAVDNQAPAAPVVHPSNGQTLSGTAEAGSTISAAFNGTSQSTMTDANGNWTLTPSSPLANGTSVSVTATDAAGNPSTATTIAVNASLPDQPTIEPSDGTTLSGTATAGASVLLSTASGTLLGQVTADLQGNWSFTPQPTLSNAIRVNATVSVDGVSSAPAITVTDTLAPDAPSILASNGGQLSGSAEPGSTVIISGPAGTSIGQVSADAQGNWSFTPTTALANGTSVSVVAQDAAGNVSAATSLVVDSVAPGVPSLQPSNGTQLAGTAEAGSTLIISDADGRVIGQVIADADGNWSLTPSPALADNSTVSVVARDAAGNTSAAASLIVDATGPTAPILAASNGSVLSGSAEAGSTVSLRDVAGNLIAEAVAAADGRWSTTLDAQLPDGTRITATASDATGNVSPSATLVIDAVAPAPPSLLASDGLTLSGSAEPGSTLILTGPGGTSLGQVQVDAQGNWSFTPATPLANGVQVSAVARDAAGNTSAASSVTIDNLAPVTPTLLPSDGTSLSGTGEPGSLLSISLDGTLIGQVTVAADGSWRFTPDAPLAHGSAVSVVARDAAGNASDPVAISIDAVPPATPTITPSDGRLLGGTAEIGSTVILTTAGGIAIGQATADDQGNWTFTPTNALLDGTQVQVVARDASGNQSTAASTVVDAIAPAAPTVLPSNGQGSLSGSAEPGSVVLLSIGGASAIEIPVGASGDWSYSLGAALPHATAISLSSRDAVGNLSPVINLEIDAEAPDAPILQPSNGGDLSGSAEAGSTVTFTSLGGRSGSTVADADGNWVITLQPPLANGDAVLVTATDAAGNVSIEASLTIDASLPEQPSIDASNGLELSGTAIPGITVLISLPGGVSADVSAAADGTWRFIPETPLANGSLVSVVARDTAGNLSASASTTVDNLAPDAPTLSPSNGLQLSGTAEAGSTVLLTGSGGLVIGQASADANGNWTLTPTTALANGVVVSAVAQDAAGNTSVAATTVIDALTPATPTIEPSSGAQLSGTAEVGSTVIVSDSTGRVIGQASVAADGSWSLTPSPALANGTQLSVVAQDAVGNSSAAASLIIDSVAPVAPSISASNGIELSGTAEAGSTVLISGPGGLFIGQTSAAADGTWSFLPDSALANGTLVSVVSRDTAGNTSVSASTVIDAQMPERPSIAPSNGDALSGTAEAGSRVIISAAGGAVIAEVTADAQGNWSFTPESALADGTQITVIARDELGNQSAPASTVIDAVAPAAPVIAPSDGLSISGSAEAGSTVTLSVDGTTIGTVQADSDGNWSLQLQSPLADATSISATASDAANNVSQAATVLVDALAPGVPSILPSNGIRLSGSAEAGSTLIISTAAGVVIGEAVADSSGNWTFAPPLALANNTQLSVVARDAAGNTSLAASLVIDGVAPAAPSVLPSNGISLTGSAEPGSTVILTGPGGVPVGQVNADASGNWSFTPAVALQNGALINIAARDAAGNTGAAVSVSIDALAPVAPTIEPSNGITLSGTAEAGSSVTLSGPGGVTLATLTADANGNWSFTPATALANGTLVNVTARDTAGNTSLSVSTTVDSLPPTLPNIAASNGLALNGSGEAGSTIIISVAGVEIDQVTVDANGQWLFTPPVPLLGNTLVSVRAVDIAGNSSASVSITVDDALPDLPVVEASDGSLLTGSAEAGSTISVTVGGQVIGTVQADPLSGAWSLPVSPALVHGTTVSVTASDSSGNVSAAAVVVVDALAPDAPSVLPSDGTTLTGTAEAGSTVIITGAAGVSIGQTTANASGEWSFTPTTPLLNGTPISVVAQDAAGNTSLSASTTVDTVAPATVVLRPSNGSLLSGTAEAGSTLILTTAGGVQIGTSTADANGNWSFSPSPALANGVSVSVVARDAAGNSGPATSVTIDAVAPTAPVLNASAGLTFTGTAEAGSTVVLSAGGTQIGTATANASGNWSFNSATPLANGTLVSAVARDAAGNLSATASTSVDGIAPASPTLLASNGAQLSGTAEAGSTVLLTGPAGLVIGEATANASGAWSFTPATPLANGLAVSAVARDAAGNTSSAASITIDNLAPSAPGSLFVSADGTLLTGNAEAGSQVRIVVGGNVANPILVTATAAGTFAAVLIPALVGGQAIAVTATDAAGNVSASGSVLAPNLSAPSIGITEVTDGYLNIVEAADGIQVRVGLAGGVRAGDTVTLNFTGSGGQQLSQSHSVTAAEVLAGSAVVSLMPPGGGFAQGAAAVTAHINSGANSQAINFTVDTVAPSSPLLSLAGNLLTINGAPNTEILVRIDLGGTVATATVTTNSAGIASLNLLSGLNVALTWDQLLSAGVSVTARDQAGNASNVVNLGLASSLQAQPITLGNLAVDANLNLLNLSAARLGISGKTIAGAALLVEVITPLATIALNPLSADANGNFSVNLLSPTVLSQLGLSVTNLLTLGPDLALRITATSEGKTSGVYTLDLDPLGVLGLTINNVRVEGTAGDDVMSGNSSIVGERLIAGDGNDLILNVGSSDRVETGAGNDTIQIKATNFTSIDGGAGFDTVLFDGGIDINYGAAGTGSFSNIERIDLGTGDSGSTLTLTAAAVNAMTDARNTLQITGENNDVLNVSGAVKGGLQQIDGISYDVYTYGSTTLLVEENTVQVVVA